MGTALRSTTDTQDRRALKKLADAAERNNAFGKRLREALKIAINEVIFEGSEIAQVRRAVTGAIADKVKFEVLPQFPNIPVARKKAPAKKKKTKGGKRPTK